MSNAPTQSNGLPEEALLQQAAAGELEALRQLDSMGFIMGPTEMPEAFAARIRTLKDNIAKMEKSLADTGKYEVEGVAVSAKDRISRKLFDEAAELDRSLYGFSIDWVPGFFIDPFFLFGGCAFAFYPEFFAMFIIRRSFRNQRKWFIYKRQELLAHELCHIARIALDSTLYEETFAYQVSPSPLRRLLGGLFLRATDSYMFLGVTFLLLFAQVLRVYWLPGLPIAPFWGLIAVTFSWLALRYVWLMRTLSGARKNASRLFGENAGKVLFRCTDSEVKAWAGFDTDEKARQWISQQDGVRWKVIAGDRG
ncbi:MAG: hypothetical protein IJT83_03110 [Victivallales bacterium]|nr:hypothetical protein [Victivallales bacterium]